jgi:hypothetical protein
MKLADPIYLPAHVRTRLLHVHGRLGEGHGSISGHTSAFKSIRVLEGSHEGHAPSTASVCIFYMQGAMPSAYEICTNSYLCACICVY